MFDSLYSLGGSLKETAYSVYMSGSLEECRENLEHVENMHENMRDELEELQSDLEEEDYTDFEYIDEPELEV